MVPKIMCVEKYVVFIGPPSLYGTANYEKCVKIVNADKSGVLARAPQYEVLLQSSFNKTGRCSYRVRGVELRQLCKAFNDRIFIRSLYC